MLVDGLHMLEAVTVAVAAAIVAVIGEEVRLLIRLYVGHVGKRGGWLGVHIFLF